MIRRVSAQILATFITRGCSHQLFAGINRLCRANLCGDDHMMRLDIYSELNFEDDEDLRLNDLHK